MSDKKFGVFAGKPEFHNFRYSLVCKGRAVPQYPGRQGWRWAHGFVPSDRCAPEFANQSGAFRQHLFLGAGYIHRRFFGQSVTGFLAANPVAALTNFGEWARIAVITIQITANYAWKRGIRHTSKTAGFGVEFRPESVTILDSSSPGLGPGLEVCAAAAAAAFAKLRRTPVRSHLPFRTNR